jgi:hypothetical protein
MMGFYFVKGDLAPIPRNSVERFNVERALTYGDLLEPFDGKNKKHREAPGAEPALAHEAAKKG